MPSRWLSLAFIVGCGAANASAEATLALPSSTSTDVAPPRVVAGGVIPNTDVEDTPDNRAVLDVCERYRTAVEARDVDITRAGLAAFLHGHFKDAKNVRYEARYLALAHADRRAMVGQWAIISGM